MKDAEDGKRLLTQAVAELREAGHRRIIAPIDGDTWHKYRLLSGTYGEPAFLMEPQNPLWYNDVYTDLGFLPVKYYVSEAFAIDKIEAVPPEVAIRGFNKADVDSELLQIYNLSIVGFADNFMYSPISLNDFYALYTPALPLINGDYTLFAEIGGETAGFLFAFESTGRLILKTIAVLPKFRGHGIGGSLIASAMAAGQRNGVKDAIAALMSEGNNSRKIAAKYEKRVIRKYTLYQLEM